MFVNELSLAPVTRQPLPSVVSHMVDKVGFHRETPLAHWALVRVDLFVHDFHMPQETGVGVQGLPTCDACMFWSVCKKVHLVNGS